MQSTGARCNNVILSPSKDERCPHAAYPGTTLREHLHVGLSLSKNDRERRRMRLVVPSTSSGTTNAVHGSSFDGLRMTMMRARLIPYSLTAAC